MDQETNKRLDDLTGKLLKDCATEKPSFDFTMKVMSRVEALSTSSTTTYKPLISKKYWMIVFVFFVGILAFAISGKIQFDNSWPAILTDDLLLIIGSFALPDFKISKIFIYGIIGFSFFTGVHIFILNRQFNKRLGMR